MHHSKTLGADLRSLRKSRRLTLGDVATRLGKSVGWLSQVERDLSTPAPESDRIVRAQARRSIGERAPGLVEDLLSPDLTGTFEVIHSTFLPGASRTKAATRETAELAVTIAGKLDVWPGEDAFTVAAGDSFRVRGESLRWANPYDAPTVAVWVISPPVY